MIVHRALPLDPRAGHAEPGGPLWFPRQLQGHGRHDNPDLYGCLYVSEEPISCIAERLAPFRGGRLEPSLLAQGGLPLGLASIEMPEGGSVIDLDDPRRLAREKLRPSTVATRDRTATQGYAADLHERYEPHALRWWSTLEASWANLTLFDRVAPRLSVAGVRVLAPDDPEVRAAADALGLA
ncbi:MAG: hypothetical protein QOJ12_2508 [Thermoleophilales bacterium]|nr:hypothetical protein [Thermoleophilales bacterium]